MQKLILFGLCLFLLIIGSHEVRGSENNCPENSLIFGMSTALSGPASQLGMNMRAGVLASFQEINSTGGISGRSLCLITLDDGYEPERTVPNMYNLIQQHKVLAVVGNVGTPTAVLASAIANRSHVPFFGAYSGAGVLRKNPPERYIINYRASYAEETAAMVDSLISEGGVRPEEIAFFTQRDAFGDSGFYGGLSALRRHGLKDEKEIAHGRYERNTTAVENGLADILMAKTIPKAIIMVGAYGPCATFIQLAKSIGLKSIFLNVSFVGSAPLLDEIGDAGEGTIITQIVPHYNANLPLVQKFNQSLRRWQYAITPSFGALEGYIVGTILGKTLHRAADPITRETIIDAFESLGNFDIGLGETLKLSPTEHQASHRIWPTIIRQGEIVPFDWKELADIVQ